MKNIISGLISILVIVSAILGIMHIDFMGRGIILYGGLLYFLIEFIIKALAKRKEV
ncbi:hypothetical protein [Aureibaculum sp. 2210JD6-5]|uniref:hypothetical protein n=1 Tax=Aureibaculum sp. 2210JD6-5 TaxID=3103957 RepID=UPI002ABE9B97|nr:hypothetical protein [Aureibaculum sp. 2210JD6-5]